MVGSVGVGPSHGAKCPRQGDLLICQDLAYHIIESDGQLVRLMLT